MKKEEVMRDLFVAVVSMSVLLASAAGAAQAESTAKLQALANVTMTSARAIALKAFPGKIVKEVLEQESGG